MAMADEDRRTSTKGTDLAATPHPQNCEFWQHPGGGGLEESIGTRVAAELTWSTGGSPYVPRHHGTCNFPALGK